MKNWNLVEAVQRKHPGWRFCLLGGDVTMGYKNDSPSRGVDENSRRAFGWKAEFFGEVDPRKDYGDRHGSVYADTPEEAIEQLCRPLLEAP